MTFNNPFRLPPFDENLPAGSYVLIVDDEDISGTTFIAYRRVATLLQVPAVALGLTQQEIYSIDHNDLTQALQTDRTLP
ncbi:Putative uncharacterized protein [Pararhodospirillum photometricum DSM 122]|uniref:Uncharacterized protein n=1 Tax=Pararhodospirillum photometricum DSM 122 TaxID=1150469 RepID=H6SRC7_PARPM|nr:Putative uncharacterized protein [Pararhodospirillum photometricum DSM 122]